MGVFVGVSRIFLLEILIFKVLTARRVYKSFGVEGSKLYLGQLKPRRSVSQTFFKWGPLLLVIMFYGPPYSSPLRKQIV
jgi:hypothetical protein